MSDDIFERERRAYALIKRSIEEMLAEGYEVRWFDSVPHMELEMLLVGPPKEGERPDVRKLVMPYQFLQLICGGDLAVESEMNWHLKQVRESSRRLHAFLHETMLKKLEVPHGGNDGSQRH